MGNATPERFNRTLLDMLGTLETHQKQDWKRYVPSLVYAYNCTPHESTSVAPFEVMFGRSPKLPIDSMFQQATEDEGVKKSTLEYIDDLKERMKRTRDIVKEVNDKAREKQKKKYDTKAKAARISVGDQELVKILKFDGKHKIADKFEEEIYEVIEKPRLNVPVFKVKSLKTEKVKTLHRNHLHPVRHRVEHEVPENESREIPLIEQKKDKDASKETKEKEIEKEETDVGSDKEDDSDEEDIFVVVTDTSEDAHIPSGPDASVIDKNSNEIAEEKIVSIETIEDKDKVEEIDSIEKESRVEESDIDTNESPLDDHDGGDVVEIREDLNTGEQEQVNADKEKERVTEKTEETEEAEENLDDNDHAHQAAELRPEPQPPPKPAPRRSGRDRKPPARYEDYHMHSILSRPVDKRTEAIQYLMESGFLDKVVSEIADRFLDAVIEK